MSITAPDDRISEYNPVVSTTEFPATFPVFDNDDLAVFVDGLERNDFTVSATYSDGISVDAKAVFASGITGTVIVVGSRQPHRTNRFNNGGPLPIRDQNLALDTIEAELQELHRDMSLALRGNYGEGPPVLGSAAFSSVSDFATAEQGANADLALNLLQNIVSPTEEEYFFDGAIGADEFEIPDGYDIGLVKVFELNGIALQPGVEWNAPDGVSVYLVDPIAASDIPDDETFAKVRVVVGRSTASLSGLDARYLSIISNPEKNMLQRGFKEDEAYHASNTALLNEAIDEVKFKYGSIFIPHGAYYVNEDVINFVDTGCFLRGQARANTNLIFRPKNGDFVTPQPLGLRFSLSSLGYAVGVKDISLNIKGVSDDHALAIIRPADQNNGGFAGPIIENVETKGIALNYGFEGGIFLENGWNARISNVLETGRPGAGWADLNGASVILGGNSTAVVIDQLISTHRDSMLFTNVGAFAEGIKLKHSEAVNVNDGVIANSALGAPEGASPPGMTILDVHFATNKTGIQSFLRPQVSISQCLIYNRLAGFALVETDPVIKAALEAQADLFVAFYANNMNQSQIFRNIGIGFGRGTFLASDTSIRTNIESNVVEDFATGFNANNNSLIEVRNNKLNSVTTEYLGMTGSISGTNRIW